MQKDKDVTEIRSKVVLAVILIVIGIVWLLRQVGVHLHLENLFQPFFMLFNRMGRIIFSWPMILVLVGLVLIAGKRQGGWILIVLGGIFIIPRIFMIPDISFSLIFPLALVIAGFVMIIKRL